MTFDDMSRAVEEAENTNRLLNKFVNRMARMLVGRLVAVDTSVLCSLKKELQGFNMHTKEWKS